MGNALNDRLRKWDFFQVTLTIDMRVELSQSATVLGLVLRVSGSISAGNLDGWLFLCILRHPKKVLGA